MSITQKKQSRRSFLKTTATAAAAATAYSVAPSTVLGANDRIQWGVIGCGGRGTGLLKELVNMSEEENIKVVHVSDVYNQRLDRAQGICEGEATMDYREILDRDDIDAVLIATPDHWHAKMTIEAMEAGKHVYCEKPLTHTIEEALQVRDETKRLGMKLQVGPQRTSEEKYWKAQKMIADGKAGKVSWAQASYNRNVRNEAFNVWFNIDPEASPYVEPDDPNYVNWDMWLGHEYGLNPRIPWNPEHFFRFRKYFQYNGGVATDLLYHFLAPLQLSIVGETGAYPRRVSAGGGLYVHKDGRDIPDVFMMTVDYPEEFSVNLISTLANNTQMPTRIYGQYATIEFTDNDAVFTGNGDYVKDFKEVNGLGENAEPTIVAEGQPGRNMRQNLIDAIRTDEKLFCNVDLGVTTMIAIKMGSESYRRQQILLWDAEKEEVYTI